MARQGLNTSRGIPNSNRYRVRQWATSTASRRVSDYLRALGLSDRSCLEELSGRIAAEVEGRDESDRARRAVAEAQRRFDAWRDQLYEVLPSGVSPIWLKQFIAAHPHLFLGDVELGQVTALTFGDPRTGRQPPRARFSTQHFERAAVPRWLVGVGPALLVTLLAAGALWLDLAQDGFTLLERVWLALFAFLFFLIAIGTVTAVLGFVVGLKRRPPQERAPSHAGTLARAEREPLPRTALIVPIYHESAEEVFAALAAMREALVLLPDAQAFEVFVLSDSRDPVLCAEEESAFRSIALQHPSVPVYYHRRALNERQKAGNVAEFFESWGPRYTYVVLLDADSLMSGETLVRLVRQMHGEPRTALLQAPIVLAGAETLFARALQFASNVCGPLFTRGLAFWSGPHGNYYGHNAVIRVSAFLSCCALPKLKGKPPLGGDVLSHDFVEAALLCRSDWEVHIAHELTGSYEGAPPTLPEYIARDRRWCQGNLQHLAIATTHGFKTMSRIHLVLGACAYLAGPVWFALLVVGSFLWRQGQAIEHFGPALVTTTALFLGTPWLLGFATTATDRRARRAHRGVARLFGGMLVSLLLGALLAPILMLHHTRIVASILTGRAVRWGAQRRRAAGSLLLVVRMEWLTTLFGLAAAACLWFTESALLPWLAPVWIPWLLSIPIVLAVSSTKLGLLVRRLGLLCVASETEPEPLFGRVEELRALTRSDSSARYRDLVLDPVLIETHLGRLEPGRAASPKLLKQLRERALHDGPASLSAEEWRVLSEDADSMRRLHREAWQHWSVESWGQARERPLVPSHEENTDTTLGDPPERMPASSTRTGEAISLRGSRLRRRVRRSRSY